MTELSPEADMHTLSERLTAGELTARSLCEFYLERIALYDGQLKSVIEVNPAALDIATALDTERAAGNSRGPLHGVPILLKDNIDTGDQMMTTAGSLALLGSRAKQDAFVAARLRAAGAVLLGKTNLSEWANFRSSRSSSGWSSRGGQTRNPYDPNRSPCGSSSGSGVAVSAGFCAAAIGTETDGSVTCPASINGIVGLKPTLGLWSRSGIIPIAHSQDTAGPMTRSVRDAALLLGLLAGNDERDAATATKRAEADYTRYLDADSLAGTRLGVVRNLTGYHEGVDTLFEASLATLQDRGAVLVDVEIQSVSKLRESEYTVLLYEMKHDLNAYLAGLEPGFPRSLAELIAFNEENADTVMPYFKQEHLKNAQAKGALTEGEYRQALEQNHRLSREEGIDKTLTDYRLEALVAPSNGPAWTIDQINGDRYLGSSSTLAAVAGYPNISVPMGLVHGLPVGLSFFANAYSESKLLAYAFAFEEAAQARIAPSLTKN